MTTRLGSWAEFDTVELRRGYVDTLVVSLWPIELCAVSPRDST